MPDDPELTIEYLGDDDRPPPEPESRLKSRPESRLGSRRRWGLAAAGVAVLLGVAAVTGVLIAPDPARPAPVMDPVPTGVVGAALRESGFGGVVGGSLSTDRAEISALRARLSSAFPFTAKPADVALLWAGDLAGSRFAVALLPDAGGPSVLAVLAGPAGAPARGLAPAWQQQLPGSGPPKDPVATFVNPFSGGRTAAVFVVAPRAAGVEIASTRRFLPGGRAITRWRSLPAKEGAVWAGAATPGEQYLATYRIAGGREARAPSIGGVEGRGTAMSRAVGRAAGTAAGRDAVGCSADAAREPGASLDERPALVSTTSWGTYETLAVTLLQSPDHAWLWGMCDLGQVRSADVTRLDSSTGSGADGVWASALDAMAAMETSRGRFAVLVPAWAVRVRVRGEAGTSTEVRDRLSVVRTARRTPVTLEALGPHDRVIAHITVTPSAAPG